MSFSIKDDELLYVYNKLWNKFNENEKSNSMKKEFDSEPLYNFQKLFKN